MSRSGTRSLKDSKVARSRGPPKKSTFDLRTTCGKRSTKTRYSINVSSRNYLDVKVLLQIKAKQGSYLLVSSLVMKLGLLISNNRRSESFQQVVCGYIIYL